MIDSKGVVVAHVEAERVQQAENLFEVSAQSPEMAELNVIIQRMMNGEHGVGSYAFEGVRKMVAFAPVPNTAWTLAINVERSDILSSLGGMQLQIILMSLVFVILGAAVIIWYSSRVTTRIIRLTSELKVISDGDFRAAEGRQGVSGKDEVTRAFLSLHHMRDSVREMIRTVKHASGTSKAVPVSSSILPSGFPDRPEG